MADSPEIITHDDQRHQAAARPQKSRSRVLWLILLLVCAALEALLLGSWLLSHVGTRAVWKMSMLGELLLHILLVAGGCLAMLRFRPGEQGKSLAVVSLVVAFFFPVAGLPAMALIALLQPGMARRAGLVSQFKHNISIQDSSAKEQVRIQDVVEFLADQVNIAPLADLVRSEDPRMRRGAIAALRKIKSPTAIKLLKEGAGRSQPGDAGARPCGPDPAGQRDERKNWTRPSSWWNWPRMIPAPWPGRRRPRWLTSRAGYWKRPPWGITSAWPGAPSSAFCKVIPATKRPLPCRANCI